MASPKGIVAMLLKRAPSPDKLGDGGSGVESEGESEGEDTPDEGDNAALESAVADFFTAGRAGKFGEAAKAYKEMHALCSDSDQGDGGDDYKG